MEALLTDIIQLLEDNKEALGVSYVDEDYGQLEALDTDMDTYPLTFPAVLVAINSIQWENENHLNQLGTASISVRLLIDCYDDTHMGSGTIDKVTARNEIFRQLTELLHGFRSDGGKDLIRTDSSFSTDSHGIKIYTNNYDCIVGETFPDGATYKTVSLKVGITTKIE